MKGKKYSEWTAEEKAQYKAKREAYWEKRKEDREANFAKLEKELIALKAPANVMQLLQSLREKKSASRNNESYLNAIFGTDYPEKGAVVSYLFVGVRGPKGERMLPNETMGKFIGRVGDCTYKYDANTIASMVWYLKKRGHLVVSDREKATVTYLGFSEIEA